MGSLKRGSLAFVIFDTFVYDYPAAARRRMKTFERRELPRRALCLIVFLVEKNSDPGTWNEAWIVSTKGMGWLWLSDLKPI